MKKTILVLLVFLIAMGVFGARQGETAEKKVVIYAAFDEKTTSELAAAFKEATGITTEIALQIEQAGTVAARIKTEASNLRADVLIGGNSNFHSDLARGGYLQKYTSPVIKEAGISPSLMDPDGYWTGWYLGALCLLYNEKLYNEKIKPLGLKPPATWDDLLVYAVKETERMFFGEGWSMRFSRDRVSAIGWNRSEWNLS